ncbi:MAG: hypothetical protein PVF56_11100 [Desulfobacterales bacterium]
MILRIILIIALSCSAFSFCAAPLFGSAAESMSAQRLMVASKSPPNIPVQSIDFGGRQPGNAATHYLKAFELLKYPESKTMGKEISEIIENGWLQDSIEIKKLLQENELSIRQYQKGIAFINCDFDFGKAPKYLFEKEFPAPAAWKLFSIIMLKGRYHERQNDYAAAVDLYLSALIFAQHISQDNLEISKATALVIGFSSLKPLKEYLNKKKVEKRLCEKIIVHLNQYHQQRFEAREIIETRREETKSLLKMTADTFMAGVTETYRQRPEILEKAAAFRKEFIMMAYQDIDYYYGNYIRATETNKKKDWEFAASESENLKRAVQAEINADHKSTLLHCFLTNLDDPNPKCTERTRIILMSGIPNYKYIFDQYNRALAELREVRSLAYERCE